MGTEPAPMYWTRRLFELVVAPVRESFRDVESFDISSLDTKTPVDFVSMATTHQEVLKTALRYALTHPINIIDGRQERQTRPLTITSARGLISKQMTDADYSDFEGRLVVVIDFSSMMSVTSKPTPSTNSTEILSNAIEQLRNRKVPTILYLPATMCTSMKDLLGNFGLNNNETSDEISMSAHIPNMSSAYERTCKNSKNL